MLITNTKFHDYYDSITAYGIDKTVVYNRATSEIKWKNKDLRTPHEEKVFWPGKGVTYEVFKYVIGFCGKLYPVVEFRLYVSGGFRTQFFYDAESVQDFLKRRGIKENRKYYYWRDDFYVTSPSGMKNWFDASKWNELLTVFQDHKVPAFVFGRVGDDKNKNCIVLNPQLKLFQFFKVKDPPTAFQDVYMYISGVLGVSTPVTVELKDKELAAKKGHGGKYSFRKPPGKRGNPKWR